MSNAQPVDQRVLVACELALVGISAAVAGGFSRLFVDGSFFPKIAAMAAVSHALAILVRRLHRGVILSGVVSLVGLCITTGLLFFASTTTAGLPTWATRDAARASLTEAWHLFGDVRAPAPVHPGFVLAAGIAMWVVAFLGDWAAFRLWSPAEAAAPAGIVFLFCSLQAANRHQLSSTAAFAGAVLVFVLLHRVARQETGASWLATEPNRGRGSVVRMGMMVGAAAVLTGLVVGPALPGAGQAAVVRWREIGKGSAASGSRVTVSPLVTIKSRLVDQSTAEAFTVKADQPDYWRLTALDKFDGTAWTSSGQYQSVKGTLPTNLPAGTTTDTLEQTFTIEALDTLWLPAAYEPSAVISDGGTKPSYEAESGTLTTGDKVPSAQGMSYVVRSQVPQRDLAALRGASVQMPATQLARYTQLPVDFPARVRRLAQSITRSASTPFDKMKVLQDYFRNNFRYDLNVQPGSGDDALQQFLFGTRAGYCEQFSSAFAAMARSLGIPARVAVGFTPGELESDGLYHVRGEYAHAWPEVYLSTIGWVRFEPTPGRGAPGDQLYTGVAPEQVTANEPGATSLVTPPTTAAPAGTASEPATAPDLGALGADQGGLATSSGAAATARHGTWTTFLTLAAVIAIAAAVLALSVPLIKTARRARRRARLRSTPRGRVDSAWADTVDALGLLDVPVDPSATPAELARRAARSMGPAAASSLTGLAELTTRARFAPEEPLEAELADAAGAARRVRHEITHRVSRWRRLRRSLDPRPLLPGSTAGPG